MNILRKLQLAFPTASKRMVRLETLPIAPSQALHLIRVDGTEYLVALGAGHPSIVPLGSVALPTSDPVLAGNA